MLSLTQRLLIGSFIIVNLIALTGCSFKPVKTTPAQTYVLNPALPTLTAKPSGLTLLVEAPRANPAVDTTQMAYVDKPYELAYFSYNQWAESPGQMLHPLLVQALQNTQHFRAIISTASSAQYDLVLNSQLLKLQQVFLQQPSCVELSAREQLINNASHQIIATQQFNISEPAPENNPYGGVIAANKATAELLQQITEFCLANTTQLKHKSA
jgi:cholesterol transport system auxiliary component